MKIDKCKLFGHKWTPAFIKGEYNGKAHKFISCYCSRCDLGYDEVLDIIGAAADLEYGTYSEKYFV